MEQLNQRTIDEKLFEAYMKDNIETGEIAGTIFRELEERGCKPTKEVVRTTWNCLIDPETIVSLIIDVVEDQRTVFNTTCRNFNKKTEVCDAEFSSPCPKLHREGIQPCCISCDQTVGNHYPACDNAMCGTAIQVELGWVISTDGEALSMFHTPNTQPITIRRN